jgi:hypothetical protein
MPAKAILKLTCWNLVMAAAIFIPVFLVANTIVGILVGEPLLDRGLAYQSAGLLMACIGLSVPVAVGVLAHSIVLAFLMTVLPVCRLRTAVLLLAPLVPLAPIVLKVRGWILLDEVYPATAIATLAYGVAMTVVISRTEALGRGQSAIASRQPFFP